MIKRFNRYEIKYSIPATRIRYLVPNLLNFLTRDPHGSDSGYYKVASLYFDTADLSCFRNKMDGLLYRRKLRIRIYPNVSHKTAFVEIKQRVNRTVQKRRLMMTLPDAYKLCSGQTQFKLSEADDQEIADEVLYLVRSMRLIPQNVISYNRLAYQGNFMDPGLRLTFDTMIRARRAGLDLEKHFRMAIAYPANLVIMEVKANEQIPHWLTTILARHECNLDRISKYCCGIAMIKQQEGLHWETVKM